MPYDTPKKNLAGAARALRTGGRELAEITGEDEPELPQGNVLRDGFRRLAGVKKPERKFGNPEE